jgi:Rab family protein
LHEEFLNGWQITFSDDFWAERSESFAKHPATSVSHAQISISSARCDLDSVQIFDPKFPRRPRPDRDDQKVLYRSIEKVHLHLMGDPTSVKLVLLGDSGVGKTSIVSQYIMGTVPDSVNPTIGAAFVTKNVTFDGKPYELLIWDTAGQEVYRGLAPMYYRSAVIAIIVFDVTSKPSYGSVSYWIKELRTNVEEGITILVCGNKIDLEDKRNVEGIQASAWATEKGALYAETSAVTGGGVEKMFQLALANLVKQKRTDKHGRANAGVEIIDGGAGGSGNCC